LGLEILTDRAKTAPTLYSLLAVMAECRGIEDNNDILNMEEY
jgi:hypothetical protein